MVQLTFSLDEIPVPPEESDKFTWAIENFSFCPSEGVTSLKFTSDLLSKTIWKLKIHIEDENDVVCRVARCCIESDLAIEVGMRIAILKPDNTPSAFAVSSIFTFHTRSYEFDIGGLLDLVDEGLLPDDILVVRFQLWWPRQLVLSGLSTVTNIISLPLVTFRYYLFDRDKNETELNAILRDEHRQNGIPSIMHHRYYLIDRDKYKKELAATSKYKRSKGHQVVRYALKHSYEYSNYVHFNFFDPYHKEEDSCQWIRIFYQKSGISGSSCISFKVSVLDSEGKVWMTSKKFNKWHLNWGVQNIQVPRFVLRSDLARAKKLLVDQFGYVTFKYQVMISFGAENNEVEKRSYDCVDRPPGNTLAQDLMQVFKRGKYSDFRLYALGQSFYVHRCIVCYRSAFLKQYCEVAANSSTYTPFPKTIDPRMRRPEEFRRLLNFLYSAEVEGEEMGQWQLRVFKEAAEIFNVTLPPLTARKENIPKVKYLRSCYTAKSNQDPPVSD